jgi:acyl-CoA thioester hydrolase
MTDRKHPADLSGYPVVIKLPILWGDQDAFGHVNNTVPIRWFESARMAYMEKCGLGFLTDASGLGPILAAIECNYRRQLHYPDTVHVGASVSMIGRTSMIMEHAVFSERLNEIAAYGSSTIVMFDYGVNKPRRMPDNLRSALEQLEGRSLSDVAG